VAGRRVVNNDAASEIGKQMTDEAPYGYIDDNPANAPRPHNHRGVADFGLAVRRILLDALHKEPQEPPTPAEIEAAKLANANWEGFIAGEKYERAKIVAWLRRHKAGIAPIRVVETLTISKTQSALIDAIEAGEHLK
jgi:hypothetical protein